MNKRVNNPILLLTIRENGTCASAYIFVNQNEVNAEYMNTIFKGLQTRFTTQQSVDKLIWESWGHTAFDTKKLLEQYYPKLRLDNLVACFEYVFDTGWRIKENNCL